MNKGYYLGIDIGGTKCVVLAGTDKMQVLQRHQFDTEPSRGPVRIIDQLLELSRSVVAELSSQELIAVGISCGGPLDAKRGIIQSPPNLPGWNDIPITKILQESLQVPVFLKNDANACALAEWKYGAGKGSSNMIFLTFGTGLGAGLILDGRLYEGTTGLAGEIGHLRLAEDGPEGYGKRGSFEGFCSGAGIEKLARKIIKRKLDNGEQVALIHKDQCQEGMSTKILAEAAALGDETALEVFANSAEYLGRGLSLLIDILNPERIVIGSVYARNPDLFHATCQEVIEREALPGSSAICQILPAALGDKVGDYACLSVAMTDKLESHLEPLKELRDDHA